MKDSDGLSKVFNALSPDNQACLLQCARIARIAEKAAGESVRGGRGSERGGSGSLKTRRSKKHS